jgi:hypothetical protein
MKLPTLLAILAAGAATSGALAQTHQPYAGHQTRAIKALSDQQIADLRAGRGMGLAMAAELNGYPGPMHVLELAAPLDLSPEQRARMAQLTAAMKAEAIPLGEKVIAAEAAMDRRFADRSIDGPSLDASVQAIGEAAAALRLAHLRYHLATVEILTAAQVGKYNELRGYVSGASKH